MLEASQQQNTLTTVKEAGIPNPGILEAADTESPQLALSSVPEGGLERTAGSLVEGGVQVGSWGRGLADGKEVAQPDSAGRGYCTPPLALMYGTMMVNWEYVMSRHCVTCFIYFLSCRLPNNPMSCYHHISDVLIGIQRGEFEQGPTAGHQCTRIQTQACGGRWGVGGV